MKSLLVCLDSSPRAPQVLATALDLAQRTGSQMLLFRTVGLAPELPSDFLTRSPTELTDALLRAAFAELEALGRGVPKELLQGVHAMIGTPWDGICRTAKERDVDMIVLGSHGYGALDRVLGTTAAKVVNHADRTVVVVRSKP